MVPELLLASQGADRYRYRYEPISVYGSKIVSAVSEGGNLRCSRSCCRPCLAGGQLTQGGAELVNGAYRLVRHAVSGRIQYSRLVGDQEYTIWNSGAQHGKGGGGWCISCGQRIFYYTQQGYFSSFVSRMASPDREGTGTSEAAGPPEEGWLVKAGKQPPPRLMGLDSSDTPPPPSPLINFARLRVQRLDGDEFTLTIARRPLLCAAEGGALFFGSEGQVGTPLTILNGSGLADAAAGVPVCVAQVCLAFHGIRRVKNAALVAIA